jgi:hypothetical protein
MSFPTLPFLAINLDRRTDRWATLTGAFPNQTIERISAIEVPHAHPADGCRMSHFAAVKLAKERNYPWVAVLEDDCYPYPDFDANLDKVCAFLWEHRNAWEIYNGGPVHASSVSKYTENFLRIGGWISSHFLIINSSIYDRILDTFDPAKDDQRIDAYYSTHFNTLASYPLIAYQIPSYSDLSKQHEDNMGHFNNTIRTFRMFF